MRPMTMMLVMGLALGPALLQAEPAAPKPGVPAVQRPMAALDTSVSIAVAKLAYWVEITPDDVWVAGSKPNVIVKIDAATNKAVFTVATPGEPCSGLAAGFGSLWVGLCGPDDRTARIDLKTGRVTAIVPHGPAPEGGLAAGTDSVWFTSRDGGTLLRIDPRSNRVRQSIPVTPGSENVIVAEGIVWMTSGARGLLTAVDARSGRVLGTTPTGPGPRFLAAGAGSIWVLNQGDGSVTRIDARSRQVVASIAVGIPGKGGDIAWGGARIWVTAFDIPLSEIDPATNAVVRQWVGPGGDSLRYGHGAAWLTDYANGMVLRIVPGASR